MNNPYKVIDNHVHIAGPGDKHPDALYWSERFASGIGFKALRILKGWSFMEVNDDFLTAELLRQIRKAPDVDYVVVLAFDHVYHSDGSYRGPDKSNTDENLTTLYVSNDYLDILRAKSDKVLLGISVHPFREDASEVLDRFQDRAVLCKWISSSQMIDFSDPASEIKLEKFYKKLKEIKLPLLFHTGFETSIPAARKEMERLNSPLFIEKALDLGVTVILAHCGCSYFDVLLDQDNVVQTVINMFQKQQGEKQDWNLYADISALFSPFRKRKILDDIFKSIHPSKLIFGSDYPNPAKGRKEFFLRPLLRFRRAHLIERYYKITQKWLDYYSKKKYFPNYDYAQVFTNFHRLLESLGRGHLIK
jgi:predicted TIM-barrel fold metal-dependent hydrolase